MEIPIGKWIGIRWSVLSNMVKGLPIFNFGIILTKTSMYADLDSKWLTVYEFEEQGILNGKN
jgi:hypothetical protein